MEDVSTQHLTVRVFDDEGVGSSQLIGAAQVPLHELEPGKVKDIWLKLVKDLVVQRDTKNRGQVSIYIVIHIIVTSYHKLSKADRLLPCANEAIESHFKIK